MSSIGRAASPPGASQPSQAGDGPLAALVALASLPGMGPSRLLALHRGPGAGAAWSAVAAGRAHLLPVLRGRMGNDPPELAARWARAAVALDPPALLAAHRAAGCTVLAEGGSEFPAALASDPEPPAVVFIAGEPRVLDLTSVAVVGTRNATRSGRDFAFELGRALVEAGVCVVSGLALGIDGATHRGAMSAIDRAAPEGPGAGVLGLPIAVVGAGLDITYPRRHADLQLAVRSCGALVSEAPLGARPEPWRFPARNRIIAALAQAVVVVESRATGGSMITAGAAADRGVPVLAVPGDVRSPGAAGTNGLLADGAHPARDVEDVLVAIGLGGRSTTHRARADRPGDQADVALLDVLGWEPSTFADLVGRLEGDLDDAAVRVARLEAEGWIERRDGWLQRAAVRRG